MRPDVPPVSGLLIANEWLDSVPLDVLEDGRLVLVDTDGAEHLGAPLSSAWADTWWPEGGRVEVGASRDLAWAAAVARERRGLAVAVDYGHTVADRRPTLTGYRDGRQVPPVPDGSCDLTAHVALDSAAAATGSLLVRQREALRALGVTAALSGQGLAEASQARELLDADGLGGFGWLLRPLAVEVGWMGV
jgi:SAM-dependent MidA family methyltransferase